MNVLSNRRQFLIGTGSLAVGGTSGCGRVREREPDESPGEARPSIPLNILLSITVDRNAEESIAAVQRSWSAISDQGLNVSVIQYDRSKATNLDDQLVDAAARHDLVVFPLAWTGMLMAAEAITPLADEFVGQLESARGGLPAALKTGAMRFGEQNIAIPFGAVLPAMLSNDDPPAPRNWQEYDEIVSDRWDGQGSEPAAPGWAGAMFLWRAMAHRRWLFDRGSLAPLLAEPHYVDALKFFVKTHRRYTLKRQTPTQIAEAISAGELRGGVGWPTSSETSQLTVGDIPGLRQPSRILLDPFTPLVALSADCRQTQQAKQWLTWIAGGEGSEVPRAAWFGRAATELLPSAQRDEDSVATEYARWIHNRLSNPLLLPTLQLQQPGRYYHVLDHEVGRALDGDQSPAQTLQSVSSQWQAIANDVGVDEQKRIWRRAQRH